MAVTSSDTIHGISGYGGELVKRYYGARPDALYSRIL